MRKLPLTRWGAGGFHIPRCMGVGARTSDGLLLPFDVGGPPEWRGAARRVPGILGPASSRWIAGCGSAVPSRRNSRMRSRRSEESASRRRRPSLHRGSGRRVDRVRGVGGLPLRGAGTGFATRRGAARWAILVIIMVAISIAAAMDQECLHLSRGCRFRRSPVGPTVVRCPEIGHRQPDGVGRMAVHGQRLDGQSSDQSAARILFRANACDRIAGATTISARRSACSEGAIKISPANADRMRNTTPIGASQ